MIESLVYSRTLEYLAGQNTPCLAHVSIYYHTHWERQAELHPLAEKTWAAFMSISTASRRHRARPRGKASHSPSRPFSAAQPLSQRSGPKGSRRLIFSPAPAPPSQITNTIACDRLLPHLPPWILYDKCNTKWQSQQVFRAYLKTLILLELELNEWENENVHLGPISIL